MIVYIVLQNFDKSSMKNEQQIESSESDLLAEIIEISTKSSRSRYEQAESSGWEIMDRTNNQEDESTSQLWTVSNPEKGRFNQYWYSQNTVETYIDAIIEASLLILETDKHTRAPSPSNRNSNNFPHGIRIAFLSTPSIYFAIPSEDRGQCFLFDIDKKWENDRGYVYFDFNDESTISDYHNQFDMAVIDPPFITSCVWKKYAAITKLLLVSKPCCCFRSKNGEGEGYENNNALRSSGVSGLILATTVFENKELMDQLFGCRPMNFHPSIPNLVYQYETYCNFPSKRLTNHNPEIVIP